MYNHCLVIVLLARFLYNPDSSKVVFFREVSYSFEQRFNNNPKLKKLNYDVSFTNKKKKKKQYKYLIAQTSTKYIG